MSYFPGHSYFLRFAAASSVISTSTGAISGAPSISGGTTFDIGYTGPNDVRISDGTRSGYGAGRRSGSYSAKGARTISLGAELRIGSGEFIATYCAPEGDALPELDLFYGISNGWARMIARAVCNSLTLNFSEANNAEVTAAASFIGRAYQSVSPITLGYDYEQFGPALLWSDTRSFAIGALEIRDKLMGLSVDLQQNVEAKGMIPEFGGDKPGSRAPYSLLPHHKGVTGSLSLHDLPTIEADLFYTAADSMQWGDITVQVSDVAVSKTFDVTIVNPRPVERQQGALESAAQMQWAVPFVADDLVVEAVDDVA